MAEKREDILEEVLEDLERESAEHHAGQSAEDGGTAEAEPNAAEDEAGEEQEIADAQETDEAEDGCEAETSGEEDEVASGESADSEEVGGAKEKKGFFKKKKDKKDEQIEELNDKLKRQMAEFENFRKRTEKEKSQMYDMGARSIIEKMLPVIDNFERGLAAVPEESKEDPFVTGMDKIYKQLLTELESIGVKPIEALGAEFDPEFHNAVIQVESEEYESGVVAQDLLRGYLYKDTVVRHSMVAVVS